jgi:lipopolysaccharide export system permease protein
VRLLDRYLLRELLVPLTFCLVGFLIFWISFDLFSELGKFQDYKLRGSDVALYYLVKIPEFLVIVLPIGLLLALLYTLTTHARHHEITAIRAAGVSLWRLSMPYLMVGVAASVVLFIVNEFWSPRSADLAERILRRRVEEKLKYTAPRYSKLLFINQRDNRYWALDYDAVKQEMRDVHVDWRFPDGSTRIFTAARGVRTNGLWFFFDVKQQTEILGNIFPTNRIITNAMAMPEFARETPELIKSEMSMRERLSHIQTDKAEVPLREIINYLRLHPHPEKKDAARIYTKMHGRIAAPWACLVVALIALPFGAASGRRNVFVGVASGIFICFAYFIFLQLGIAFGTGGYLPPWLAAWLPNLLFGGTALFFIFRVR